MIYVLVFEISFKFILHLTHHKWFIQTKTKCFKISVVTSKNMLSSFETPKAKKKKESVNISHMRTFCKNLQHYTLKNINWTKVLVPQCRKIIFEDPSFRIFCIEEFERKFMFSGKIIFFCFVNPYRLHSSLWKALSLAGSQQDYKTFDHKIFSYFYHIFSIVLLSHSSYSKLKSSELSLPVYKNVSSQASQRKPLIIGTFSATQGIFLTPGCH